MAADPAHTARTDAIRTTLRDQAQTVWANRLHGRMDALGVSTQALADAAGTTYQTVWRVLKGDLYPKEYLRIAMALSLGAEVEQLFPMPSREILVAQAERAEASARIEVPS